MDTLKDGNHIKPMGYYYIASTPSDLAKMDACIEKVLIIPEGYKKTNASCKEGLDRQVSDVWIQCPPKEETDDASPTLPGSCP
jgi:hypothetical protein